MATAPANGRFYLAYRKARRSITGADRHSADQEGGEVLRKVFPARMTQIKPFFERALTPPEATQLKELRLCESFRQGGAKVERGKGESFFVNIILTRTDSTEQTRRRRWQRYSRPTTAGQV